MHLETPRISGVRFQGPESSWNWFFGLLNSLFFIPKKYLNYQCFKRYWVFKVEIANADSINCWQNLGKNPHFPALSHYPCIELHLYWTTGALHIVLGCISCMWFYNNSNSHEFVMFLDNPLTKALKGFQKVLEESLKFWAWKSFWML